MDSSSLGAAYDDLGKFFVFAAVVLLLSGVGIGVALSYESGPSTHEICQWRLDQVTTAADTLLVLDDHRECFNSVRIDR